MLDFGEIFSGRLNIVRWRPVAGGDIARAFRVEAGDGTVFVKVMPATAYDRLTAEAEGLKAIAATATVRVPEVLGTGQNDDQAWLVLEWLDLDARDSGSERRLGEALAALHRHTDEIFGWPRDNFIGLTPQPNTETHDWAEFFVQYRLVFQLELLARKHGDDWAKRLHPAARACERDLAGHRPDPSPIHGDLWSGNAAALADGTPVIYDPAVHYADRECDLAMTALFGGFSSAFGEAYNNAWPLPAGIERRRHWYQLYHVLNHACLFGGSYLDDARRRLQVLIG